MLDGSGHSNGLEVAQAEDGLVRFHVALVNARAGRVDIEAVGECWRRGGRDGVEAGSWDHRRHRG
jgi:hypothetical protein